MTIGSILVLALSTMTLNSGANTCQTEALKQGLEVIKPLTSQPTQRGYLLTMLVRRNGLMYNVNCDYIQSEQSGKIFNAPIDPEGIMAACHRQGNDQLLTVLRVDRPLPGKQKTTMAVKKNGNFFTVNCTYSNGGKTIVAAKDGITDRLLGTSWVLKEDPQITIAFPEVGRIAGSGGCNRYFGSFTIVNGRLQVKGIGSTKKACIPEVMKGEDNYFRQLSRANRIQIEENQLTIGVADSAPLVFVQGN